MTSQQAGAKPAADRALTRPQTMARLLQGVTDDVAAYETLLDLLQQQFEGALRHQSVRLTELAARILPLVEAMEERRGQRVALMQSLLGVNATMAGLLALLKGDSRRNLEENWAQLEQLVLECKQCNARNSALLTEQYAIMQRVLHGEDNLYAPA